VSLLLDALKKAEKAKEAAQRGEKKSDAPSDSGLRLEPTTEEARRVMTRDKLPDISTPLDIGGDDLSPRQAAASAEEMPGAGPESALPPGSRTPARSATRPAAGNPAAQRAAAQSVFEAKFKEPNPRLPFYITIGALSAFAIGTIVYFWIQLRPPPPLVYTNPKPPAAEQTVATANAPAAAAAAPASQGPSGQAIPGLPGPASTPTSMATRPAPQTTAKPAPKAAPVMAAASSAKAPPAAPQPAPRAAPVVPASTAQAAQSGITRSEPSPASAPRSFGRRTVARVNPGVAAGYAAYQSGDLASARSNYQQALRAEPKNIDALLGMAAVELRARQYAAADHYYRQALRLDPRNPYAHAGMLALRNQQVDPVAAESRVKSLIASEPGAEELQFTLGNQYAQQRRWGEAQQAYFKALAGDPKNPDFAYNLAVSLDHLRQVKPALQHYRLALSLAEGRSTGFDAQAVRARIAQLER
jgi:tetratricopeptide (TPR) repeat protein